jgi:hypothetical protein
MTCLLKIPASGRPLIDDGKVHFSWLVEREKGEKFGWADFAYDGVMMVIIIDFDTPLSIRSPPKIPKLHKRTPTAPV